MDFVRFRELALAAAVLIAGVAACGWLVFVTKLGPTVATVSGSHGIHLGDLLVFPMAVFTLVVAASAARSGRA